MTPDQVPQQGNPAEAHSQFNPAATSFFTGIPKPVNPGMMRNMTKVRSLRPRSYSHRKDMM